MIFVMRLFDISGAHAGQVFKCSTKHSNVIDYLLGLLHA